MAIGSSKCSRDHSSAILEIFHRRRGSQGTGMGKKPNKKKSSGKAGKASTDEPVPVALHFPWSRAMCATRGPGGRPTVTPSGRMGGTLVAAPVGSGCDAYLIGGYNGE